MPALGTLDPRLGWYDAVLEDALGDDPLVDPETCLIKGTIFPDPKCIARRVAPLLPKPPILVPAGPGLGTLVLAGVVLWWITRRR